MRQMISRMFTNTTKLADMYERDSDLRLFFPYPLRYKKRNTPMNTKSMMKGTITYHRFEPSTPRRQMFTTDSMSATPNTHSAVQNSALPLSNDLPGISSAALARSRAAAMRRPSRCALRSMASCLFFSRAAALAAFSSSACFLAAALACCCASICFCLFSSEEAEFFSFFLSSAGAGSACSSAASSIACSSG